MTDQQHVLYILTICICCVLVQPVDNSNGCAHFSNFVLFTDILFTTTIQIWKLKFAKMTCYVAHALNSPHVCMFWFDFENFLKVWQFIAWSIFEKSLFSGFFVYGNIDLFFISEMSINQPRVLFSGYY